MPDTTRGHDAVYETARHTVEDLLKLKDFINTQWDKIETRLLGAETRADETEKQAAEVESRAATAASDAGIATGVAEAKSAGQSANIVFFAECLPYAAAIVHTGSTLSDFAEARKWASDRQPQPADAVSVLAVLTFFYLVERGTKLSAGKDAEKWQSIRRRVNNLLGLNGSSEIRQPPEPARRLQIVS